MDDFLKRRPLPEFVHRYEVELGEDSVGDPAVYVLIYVDDDKKPSKEKLSQLRDLTDSLSQDLIVKLPQRWPYIRIRSTSN